MSRFTLTICLLLFCAAAAEAAGACFVTGRILHQNKLLHVQRRGSAPDQFVSKLESDGRFTFPAVCHEEYEFSVADSDAPPYGLTGVGRITVSEGKRVDLGDIVLQAGPSRRWLKGDIAGSVKVVPVAPSGMQKSIAALLACADGLSVVHEDGTLVRVLHDKEQAGFDSLQIALHKKAAGWLNQYDGCCQSYPLALRLTVYQPGQKLVDLTGDGRYIFGWKFTANGRQVAMYQSFPHGEPRGHFELHDVASGRLLARWEGETSPKAPSWTRDLK